MSTEEARKRQRRLTREDVAWILEQRSEGIKLVYIAHYVYGMSAQNLISGMRTWGAI